MKHRSPALIALLLSSAASYAATPGSPQVTKAACRQGPPPDKTWKMVWNDEFEGTAVDLKLWQVREKEKWHWPGFKTQYADANCALDGKGSLVLRLTQDADGTLRFNQGLQSRSFQKTYGYFETRVQFSTQPGWWTAVWLSGIPYNEGSDPFVNAQEFDIFEDFYKPKNRNDISHCYHVTAGLATVKDQGNGKGIGGDSMLARTKIGRVSKGKEVAMEEYGGWHTVGLEWSPLEHVFYVDGQETLRLSYREIPITTVPQRVWVSECLPTPEQLKKPGAATPFYGWLENAKFPDQLVVDYVRVYDEDTGGKTAPVVAVTLDGKADGWTKGQAVTFRVHAEDKDGSVKSVYLFSKGYIRAEAEVNSPKADQAFTLNNLFDGENTLIAMAKDDNGLVGISQMLRVKVSPAATTNAVQNR